MRECPGVSGVFGSVIETGPKVRAVESSADPNTTRIDIS